MVNSVLTFTFVTSGEISESWAVIVALAFPAPRVSLPSPLLRLFAHPHLFRDSLRFPYIALLLDLP